MNKSNSKSSFRDGLYMSTNPASSRLGIKKKSTALVFKPKTKKTNSWQKPGYKPSSGIGVGY